MSFYIGVLVSILLKMPCKHQALTHSFLSFLVSVVTIEYVVDSPGLDEYCTKQKRKGNACYPQPSLCDKLRYTQGV